MHYTKKKHLDSDQVDLIDKLIPFSGTKLDIVYVQLKDKLHFLNVQLARMYLVYSMQPPYFNCLSYLVLNSIRQAMINKISAFCRLQKLI